MTDGLDWCLSQLQKDEKWLVRPPLPGEEKLALFLNKLANRVRNDWDAVISLSGKEGCGKSSLGIKCLWYLKPEPKEFKLEDNIIVNPTFDNVTNKILFDLPKYAPIQIDEAIKVAYKLNWYTGEQKKLDELLALCRKENKIIFMCMPRFADFPVRLREHRVSFWIQIIGRGNAVVFSKDESPFITDDAWNLKDNDKKLRHFLRGKSLANISPSTLFATLKNAQLKGFVSSFSFRKLDSNLWNQYQNMVKTVKYDVNFDKVTGMNSDSHYTKLTKAILSLYESGVSQPEISKKLGMSLESVNRALKKYKARPIDKASTDFVTGKKSE